MAYSNKYLKGSIGFTGDWPVIVIERSRSDAPLTPVLCEVFGFSQECGSCYAKDIYLVGSADGAEAWKEALQGKHPYFKAPIFYTDLSGTKHTITL